MPEYIREAIQRFLDETGDGWTLTQFVVAMGLQRINSDGSLESIAWYASPTDQPDWQTGALLEQASELHSEAEIDED